MLTRDCLAEALQNLSGKSIPADVLAKCETTCDVLDEFNKLYTCVVTFSGVLSSENVSDTMVVTVKDADGKEIAATEKNKYTLKEGTYSYSATCTGAQAKTDVALKITNDDEQKGTKSVVINFTAAA